MKYRWIKNFIGNIKGYGHCLNCGDTWDYKKAVIIPYDDSNGMFPLCEECFTQLSPETIIEFCHLQNTVWDEEGFTKILNYKIIYHNIIQLKKAYNIEVVE